MMGRGCADNIDPISGAIRPHVNTIKYLVNPSILLEGHDTLYQPPLFLLISLVCTYKASDRPSKQA